MALKDLLNEFKQFALQGNAVDLAVGVVIGAAFGSIVNSLVKDIIMPPIGLVTGGVDFSDKMVVLKHAVLDASGKVLTPETDLRYGVFINNVINFLIVAVAIFGVIKLMSMMKPKEKPVPAGPPPLTPEEQLLTEIRDAIKSQKAM
jgi:large conductance mechanosensitive channel